MVTPSIDEQIRISERYSRTTRELYNREMAEGEAQSNSRGSMRESIQRFVLSSGQRYKIFDQPIILYETDMHDLSHLVSQLAKIIHADDPAQDRLMTLILEISRKPSRT